MKERPILFSGPMVRAIIAGTKTQTRRVMAEGVTIMADAEITSEFIRWEKGPAQLEYWALWESINGKGSWLLNPWVWVVEFKALGVENDQTQQPPGTGTKTND